MAEAADDELREFLVERSDEAARPEDLALRLRHDVEKSVRIDVEVAHLDHLHGQLAEERLPGRKLFLAVVEAWEVEQVQRDVDAVVERVADRRDRGTDARVFSDVAGFVLRNVKVGADEDALAGDVEVGEFLDLHDGVLLGFGMKNAPHGGARVKAGEPETGPGQGSAIAAALLFGQAQGLAHPGRPEPLLCHPVLLFEYGLVHLLLEDTQAATAIRRILAKRADLHERVGNPWLVTGRAARRHGRQYQPQQHGRAPRQTSRLVP